MFEVLYLILTLKGHSSTLSIDFVTPIQLHLDLNYELALISFHSYKNNLNNYKGSEIYMRDSAEKELTIELLEVS